MLNFPFPYELESVQKAFSEVCKALAEALTVEEKALTEKVTAYQEARGRLQATLDSDSYKYLSFQRWQEGIARYTEYRLAKLAAEKFKPSREFQSLKDYTPFAETAERLHKGVLAELSTLSLGGYKRVAFYPLGAGEAMLCDRVNPRWQRLYFQERFTLDSYFAARK
jgi:hypothetical protein